MRLRGSMGVGPRQSFSDNRKTRELRLCIGINSIEFAFEFYYRFSITGKYGICLFFLIYKD